MIHIRRVQPAEASEFDAWIAERHYRGCTPAGAVLRLEFHAQGQRVGAIMFGRPEARMLNPDADHLLELTRMFFVDGISRDFTSRLLAQARAHVRKWFPQIRLLLSYSDPEQGHEGTVYIADGWARFGRTTPKAIGWKNREGRKDACGHSKMRFVRTP